MCKCDSDQEKEEDTIFQHETIKSVECFTIKKEYQYLSNDKKKEVLKLLMKWVVEQTIKLTMAKVKNEKKLKND